MVDGITSASALIQFLKELNHDVQIDWLQNYEKGHGLLYSDISKYPCDRYGLIIVPDASMTCKDAKQITDNFVADILVLDHHIQESEFYNKETEEWITRDEAKILYKKNKNALVVENYTSYCTAVNCTDGQYPNPTLSGAGVVQKFIEAYVDTYGEEDYLPQELKEQYLDLVSLAINADGMDLRNCESRYYVLEGMKEKHYHNDFISELVLRNEEDMKWGRYINSMSWNIAPKINAIVRYGKEEEQINVFRAVLGEQEDMEYQPRRKHKTDPKPPIEIQSLQKYMARVCENVKARQDTEVRKFVADLDVSIKENELDKNSVIFVDGTKVLTKGTVTGLVANKLASKYFRPVVLIRNKDTLECGGSGRNYSLSNIENLNEFLSKAGVTCMGHENAFGISFKKAQLNSIIDKCNEMMPLEKLTTVHICDWEIAATRLKSVYVQEVAENYAVWCSTVPEPTFAITNLRINASQIMGYGENNGFIRFVYNGIPFIKKYCQHDEFDKMTLKNRQTLGINKKELNLNLICQFVLNSYDDKILPQVKILYFDSEEVNEANEKQEDNFEFEEKINTKIKKQAEYDDDDFDW